VNPSLPADRPALFVPMAALILDPAPAGLLPTRAQAPHLPLRAGQVRSRVGLAPRR